MARTNRQDALLGAKAGTSNTTGNNNTVDALDDLDLDDMFQDGDDNLFDGLDIDLDGMGDITQSPSTTKNTVKMDTLMDKPPPSLPSTRRSSAQATPASSVATSTRRKTKRKTKSPASLALDDDDEDYEPTPKKKKRTTKKKTSAKTKSSSESPSKKTSKAGLNAAQTALQEVYGQSRTGPWASSGRAQKKGQALIRQTSAASSVSALSEATSVDSKKKKRSASESLTYPNMPPQDTTATACGLAPGPYFFPYMTALPPETSMKKANRLFGTLDSIHSATIFPPTEPPSANSLVSENLPLYRLLVDEPNSNAGSTFQNNTPLSRRMLLTNSIMKGRTAVASCNKTRLVNDLHSACKLLGRQYAFLAQSLDNMERWSREHFDEADYLSVYGQAQPQPPAASSRKRKSSTAVWNGLYLGKFRNSVLKVKIKCNGFKEPKQGGPLVAILKPPPGVVLLPPAAAVPKAPSAAGSVKSSTSSKKRKAAASPASEPPTGTTSKPLSKPPTAKNIVATYASLKPWQRRHRVSAAILKKAHQVDLSHKERRDKLEKTLQKQQEEQQKVVEEDQIHVVSNTIGLWKWMEKSEYFTDFSKEDIQERLVDLWEPDIVGEPEVGRAVLPLHKEAVSKTRDISMRSPGVVGSMVSRLQSLLVDVNEDDGEEDDDEDDSLLDEWEAHQQQKDDSTSTPAIILDLTGLSSEERAYLHCRSAGLVAHSSLPPPPSKLTHIDSNTTWEATSIKVEPVNNVNGGTTAHMGKEKLDSRGGDDIDHAIKAMQTALHRQHRLNNGRLAFLESTALSHLEEVDRLKKKEDQDASLLSRYNQVLKKQRELKKTARQKSAKQGESALPW